MRALTSFIILCILSHSASAYITVGNQRLDHAIYAAGHAPKLIVAGQIKKLEDDPVIGLRGAPRVNIEFDITSVILGEQKYGMSRLDINLSHFDWPHDLVQLEKDVRCILVLRSDQVDGTNKYSVVSVVPAHRRSLKRVKDGEQAKRVLEAEIVSELVDEKSTARQTELLIQVAPILTKDNAQQVVPFVESKNPWVKRAALAGMIYATEDEEYIRQAAIDVQAFFTATGKDDLIDGRLAPYPFFLKHFFFLEKRSWTFGSRWSVKEAEKHLRILKTMLDLNVIDDKVASILNPNQD